LFFGITVNLRNLNIFNVFQLTAVIIFTED
jgi:hypothetical protein